MTELQTLPVLPLRGGALFPYAVMPITVGRARTGAAVEAALATEEKLIFVVGMKDPSIDPPGQDDVHRVGTIGVITQMRRIDGAMQLTVTADPRVEQRQGRARAGARAPRSRDRGARREGGDLEAYAAELSEQQREHILRQQLKSIQEKLGEADPEQAEIALLEKRIAETDLPEIAKTEVARELDRMRRLPSASQEHHVIRSCIELILDLPWTKRTAGEIDIARARMILDEDHHGLDDVKTRILEHLAVHRLNPSAKAPILCFVGPPGVGKTSVGRSIARALARKFERMSLGGLHDEAELRGHRRTYVAAMPGRIIQAIRSANTSDPVLMLDEIDKLGRDFRGDPAAALLEVLDPEQHDSFRDNYLVCRSISRGSSSSPRPIRSTPSQGRCSIAWRSFVFPATPTRTSSRSQIGS